MESDRNTRKYKNDLCRKWHFWHFDIIKSAENVNNATLRN